MCALFVCVCVGFLIWLISGQYLRNRFQTATATAANTPGLIITEPVRKCFLLTTHSTHFIYGYMATWATLSD